jgi:general secretion pathway protein G
MRSGSGRSRAQGRIRVRPRGFTLIELMVVLAIVGLLMSIVSPRYFRAVTRAEETVLRENLWVLRDAIDKYYADTGRYPDSLQDLVTQHYLRTVPVDPMTQSDASWTLIPPQDTDEGAVFDVRSGAEGNDRGGVPYAQW